MTRNQDDHALNALERAAQKTSKPISEKLLADLYSIQKEHQFDVDRTVVVEAMEKRIIAEVEVGSTSGNKE